jgi:hypothetical protein
VSPPGGPPRLAALLGRVPIHPVLLAAWPALALWAANVREATPGEVWPVVWLPAAVAVVVWLVLGALMRSAHRGALATSVAVVVLLNAGQPSGGQPGTTALAVSVIAVVTAVVVTWQLGQGPVMPLTAVGNVIAVVLVALALPPILSAWGPGSSGTQVADRPDDVGGLAGRDIWYIIPDRYPRADTLQQVFAFDNRPFLDGLEERGFQVQSRALANYPKTAHSLGSSWNLELIQDLIPEPPDDGSDWQPLYRLLRDHRLGHILTDAGYEYIHLGTWWSPTATATSADRVLRYDTRSEFGTVWQSLTVWPAVVGATAEDPRSLTLRERNRLYSAYQFDMLDRLAEENTTQPRFVLAHITVPHEPYVFDADGSLVTQEQQRARTREENFLNQVVYLNSRLDALFGQLTSGPPETWPVIVLKSDEGPHPRTRSGPAYDWLAGSDEALWEKLRTISAVLLPESDVVIPEDLTAVNMWRLVLDATIGTEFGLIDDPIYGFPSESRLYDLVDVTDRVRAGDPQ